MDTVATGLTCPAPNCDGDTRVIDTTVLGDRIRRERICKDPSCRTVFATVEDLMGSAPETVDDHDHTSGMPCPACGGSTTVKQTRRAAGQVRRRRTCLDCDHAFKTKERPDR